mmetsp:Transcript_14784/g.34668  ORF Transcript_14784/g.34668 Transcript_14784/m.34668 type:complete len:283 (-) Transcript_14784:2162-3010(-)
MSEPGPRIASECGSARAKTSGESTTVPSFCSLPCTSTSLPGSTTPSGRADPTRKKSAPGSAAAPSRMRAFTKSSGPAVSVPSGEMEALRKRSMPSSTAPLGLILPTRPKSEPGAWNLPTSGTEPASGDGMAAAMAYTMAGTDSSMVPLGRSLPLRKAGKPSSRVPSDSRRRPWQRNSEPSCTVPSPGATPAMYTSASYSTPPWSSTWPFWKARRLPPSAVGTVPSRNTSGSGAMVPSEWTTPRRNTVPLAAGVKAAASSGLARPWAKSGSPGSTVPSGRSLP